MKFLKQFGAKPSAADLKRYSLSRNWNGKIFENIEETTMDFSWSKLPSFLKKQFFEKKGKAPETNITIKPFSSQLFDKASNLMQSIWYGHSAIFMQLNQHTILIDPMFGPDAAPIAPFAVKRFSEHALKVVEEFPQIDLVLLSHDHYDHLDYESIQKLKDKVNMFYTPLGVGIHLLKWGIEKERIIELDWWQEIKYDELTIRCTPAQHFSGRGLADREKTLWCSWIIQSDDENLFFSGDSGYASHFKEIGNQYGPFDFAFMECGQYNNLWPLVHMFPEETAQAGLDIKAKKMMPIHWGAFKLASHSWTDPVERLSKKAKELKIDLVIPKIGEFIEIELNNSEEIYPWWRN